MKVRKVEDREGLRGRLVARAEEKARGLVRKGGGWDPHITLKTLRLCREDSVWVKDYEEYAGEVLYRPGNRIKDKHSINCELGKKICAAVGGEMVRLKGIRPIGSEIAGAYSLLRRGRD